ncbi:MAG: hypothetical protein ABIJ18_03245 [archaeon]
MDTNQVTEEIKARETARFNYKGKVLVRELSREPCFSGSIDMLTTAKIEVGYNPDYPEEAQHLEGIVTEPFERAMTSVLRHELNHKGGGEFQGCPRNIDLHAENVLEPAAEVLQSLGLPNVPVTENQTLYAYMANLIEDVFDNAELGNNSDHVGMFLAYKDDAQHLPDDMEGKLSPLFDAFVQLQQKLYGGRASRKLLAEHYSDDNRVQTAIDNFMQRSGLTDMTREVTTRRRKERVEIFDRKEAVQYLMDENNWPELSKILTEEFAELIDKNKLQQPDYVKGTFIPLKGEADGFSDEMDDKETKMRLVWKKYVEGKGKESSPAFQPPAYLESFEALDLVYQRLARNLEIKTKASTRTASMPVMHYGKRKFDPRRDKLSKARIGFGRKGKLELSVGRFHEDYPVEYTERMRSLPEIKFVMMDTSGSMSHPVEGSDTGKVMNPWADERRQWGDNSRYHHALVAWYGLLGLLRKQGTLKHKSVKLANYSSSTQTASDLRDAKKLALTPQFGGTELDLDTIDDMFGRDQLIFSLSDGDVDNWNRIKDEYIQRAKQNHYFHLQIGGETAMSRDLESAGLVVKYDDGKNLGKMVIDLTRPYITRMEKK